MTNAEFLIIILLFAILIMLVTLLVNVRVGCSEIVKALQAIYDRRS